ncbi:Ras- protein Rab-7A [Apophysomyces ossiformis]|uniref:Ras-related protein Rab-7b n=1 Tax=Apophysomyces ossiformis TaxID=679940 RepID=A0A8H7BWQ7_9FUNG|nr:Ras- protein Rab-7A [Apophysomyces ossiformis]
MVLGISRSAPSVAPTAQVTPITKNEKTPNTPIETKKKKRPFMLRARSCNAFIFATASVGLFTSTFVHSILFPLSPFIVSRIEYGSSSVDYEKAFAITADGEETSRETGILVALYAVGLLAGSPLFGWLGDTIKQRRLPMLLGLQMGKLVGFYPLGMMIGLPVGVLYSRVSPQAPFVASMIFSGIDFFMRLVIIERSSSPKEWFADNDIEASENQPNSGEGEGEGSQAKSKPRKVTLMQLLRQPRLIVSMILTMVVAAVMSGFEPTLSMRLAAEWNFDAAASGLILIAYMVPSIASSAFCGWLCDRYGTKIVAIVSLVLVTPACIAIGIPDHRTTFWTLIPALALGGITIAGCQAPVFPEIAQVVAAENKNKNDKDGLARSYAVFNAAYGTGMCVGPLIAGFLYGSVGFFWLCFTLAMMFLCCIPIAYFYTGGTRQLIVRRTASQLDESNMNPTPTVQVTGVLNHAVIHLPFHSSFPILIAEPMHKDILKVVLIGDGGVGKTSLRNQFIHKRFTNTYKATIGADFVTKQVLLDDGKKVMMQIWDTAGQERFQSLGVAYYRGADACVLVYDVNNFMSFQHLGRWHDDFLKQSALPPEEARQFPILMIGNKIDINDRVVSRRQARAWAEQHSSDCMQIPCFEASAKDGTNVEKAFTHIAKMVKVPQLELDLNEGDSFTLTSDTRPSKPGQGLGCC